MTNEQNDLVQRVKDDSMIALPTIIGAGVGVIVSAGILAPLYAAAHYYAGGDFSASPQDLIYGAIGGALLFGGVAIGSRAERIRNAEKEMKTDHSY